MKSISFYSLVCGSVLGLLFFAGLFLSWNTGMDTQVGFHKYYALLPLVFLSILAASFWLEKKSEGAVDWKMIIRFALLSYVVFEVFYGIANYLLFDIVDPGAYIRMVDYLNQEDVARLKAANAPVEKIKEVIKMGEFAKQPISWMQRLVGIGQNLILDFIKSVLIGFIIKQVKR